MKYGGKTNHPLSIAERACGLDKNAPRRTLRQRSKLGVQDQHFEPEIHENKKRIAYRKKKALADATLNVHEWSKKLNQLRFICSKDGETEAITIEFANLQCVCSVLMFTEWTSNVIGWQSDDSLFMNSDMLLVAELDNQLLYFALAKELVTLESLHIIFTFMSHSLQLFTTFSI
jgi:hypothetical protein